MKPLRRSRTLLLELAQGSASCDSPSNTGACDTQGSVEGQVTLSPDVALSITLPATFRFLVAVV